MNVNFISDKENEHKEQETLSDVSEVGPIRKGRTAANLQFDLLLENLPGVVYRCQLDTKYTVQFVTDSVLDLTGYPAEYFLSPPPGAQSFGELIHELDRDRIYQEVCIALDQKRSYRLVYRITTAQGVIKWVSGQGAGIFDEDGKVTALEGFIIDITSLKQSTDLAMEQASLLDHAHDAIFVTDHQYAITYWNASAEKLYGWSSDEAVGRNCFELIFRQQVVIEQIVDTVLTKGEWAGDVEHFTRSDKKIFVSGRYTCTTDEHGHFAKMLYINTDVTDRREAESKIHHLAFYDALTNLPNRAYFMERLQRTLAGLNRHGHYGTLMFLDLDEFKTLNDTRGHAKGDLLLTCVARALEQNLRENDFVARLGGDEFVVLLESDSTDELEVSFDSAVIAQKILHAVAQPFDLSGMTHHVSTSIGVTFFEAGRITADEILKQADMAMYQAKLSGRNQVCYFDEKMHTATVELMELETEFQHALINNELHLEYQPQVNAAGAIVGVEALLRWNHPVRGRLLPDAFLGQIEPHHHDSGLCNWVLVAACNQLVKWYTTAGMEHLFISVNLSAHKFKSQDFPGFVEEILKASRVNAHLLKLELPETVFAFDIQAAAAKMEQLKQYGVRFTLDNFGTSTSSMSILNSLPFDEIKIDRSLIDALDVPFNCAMIRSMLTIGKAIGMEVIAEGVETHTQHAILSDAGFADFQGRFFYPPMDFRALETLFAESLGVTN